jgi:hypothetical protein
LIQNRDIMRFVLSLDFFVLRFLLQTRHYFMRNVVCIIKERFTLQVHTRVLHSVSKFFLLSIIWIESKVKKNFLTIKQKFQFNIVNKKKRRERTKSKCLIKMFNLVLERDFPRELIKAIEAFTLPNVSIK